ncbi:phenylalanine--tRNA ligase subunit beta [Candidatus Vallotia tarda]|uniref:Phenylalanine--tRNA ligase beta subunit n=1 Tax=Candidatus Vallotiella hemipterorum TaxID=1177213 RepID=A0A916NGE6_9BURK|nr:phenylalanine--tRNA ligase subunit beta [Candidatus Vallotia tarda]CAG7603005.1 Phenylalanine--tRNA ligase beta subunit [Candidatus Vallotia tarda]
MQFAESWLRSFVNPQLSTDALSRLLTMAGLEVEALLPVVPPTSKIVIGKVLQVIRHPNADNLKLCQVDVGTGQELTIVCGAPNVAPDIKVPTALVGAILPPKEEGGEPIEIKPLKLRGLESQGMLCSAGELKLSDNYSELLILSKDTPIGCDIRDVLQLSDIIFKIKPTPNRSDCLSVFGIARETAALTGARLNSVFYNLVPVTCNISLPVRIDAPQLCGRFSGRVIRDINPRTSTPLWMVQRLEQAGQHSISALVDISNYVMLELGRPSHIFDLDKINGGLHVRWGRRGETLKLLNGNTVCLDETVGVIANNQGRVESLAGIMGGDNTAVTFKTKHIYLEAAFWWPDSIRGRASHYNILTDAAYRFERGVDYATIVEHIEYLTYLITIICGGNAGPVEDQIINLPQSKPVSMRVSQANRIIGVPFNSNEVDSIFKRLNLSFKRLSDGDEFIVTPPTYRFDIEIEEDLIEEIARIWGYEKIPLNLPVAASKIRVMKGGQRSIHALRHALAARDYTETVNFSFVDAESERDFAGNEHPISLLNPISSQLSVIRSTLFGSLVKILQYNLNRRASRVRIFEVGRVFRKDLSVKESELTVKSFAQPKMIGALAYGPVVDAQWGVSARHVDFFDVKGDVQALCAPTLPRFIKALHPALHPGRSARIEINGHIIGWIGDLHPCLLRKYNFSHTPVLFEIEADAVVTCALPNVTSISKFPPVHRDISVIVRRNVEVQSILDEFTQARLNNNALRFAQKMVLFDEFHYKFDAKQTNFGTILGELSADEKSLAFRITLQDTDKPLRDETIALAIKTLATHLSKVFGARLRS